MLKNNIHQSKSNGVLSCKESYKKNKFEFHNLKVPKELLNGRRWYLKLKEWYGNLCEKVLGKHSFCQIYVIPPWQNNVNEKEISD